MMKKIIAITITILILMSALVVFNQNTSSALTNNPSKINMYIGPTSVLADNNTIQLYFCAITRFQRTTIKSTT